MAKHPKPARSRKPAPGDGTLPKVRPIRPLKLSRLKLHSVRDRSHLSQLDRFARLTQPRASFAEWFETPCRAFSGPTSSGPPWTPSSPRQGRQASRVRHGRARGQGRVGPLVIDLMRRGVVTGLACHGATAIHDLEIAMLGATSEDVGDTIRDGRFGMVRETMEFFADAARLADRGGIGLGQAVGQLILKRKFPHADYSLLASAARMNLPARCTWPSAPTPYTWSPRMDGRALGAATLEDFRKLCAVVGRDGRDAGQGCCGVWCNVGSAVLLPEVFLKAISVARNPGANIDALTTVNFDMLRHYRPAQNVVGPPGRPGHGHDVAGHHEILLPMLRQALIERLSSAGD